MGSSIPSTPHSQTFMLPDKGHATFHPQLGKPELDRQMTHDYQQPTATSHGMTMTPSMTPTSYVQGWPQPPQQQPEMSRTGQWEYYNKYSNPS